MNEFFSPISRKVCEFSILESRRLSHDYQGTEHLLLGILRQGKNKAIDILCQVGVDPEKVRISIENGLNPDLRTEPVAQPPFTKRAKRVLDDSGYEARMLKSPSIEPEHILLALVKNTEGVAAQVLSHKFNLDYADIFEQLMEFPGVNVPDGFKKDTGRRLDFPVSEDFCTVIENAKKEAGRLRNTQVGTSHLFLGLINLGSFQMKDFLTKKGIDLVSMRARLEDELSPYEDDQVHVYLEKRKMSIKRPPQKELVSQVSDAVMRVMTLSYKEARNLRRREIDTTCLLLALMSIEGSLVARMLVQAGSLSYKDVKLEALRQK